MANSLWDFMDPPFTSRVPGDFTALNETRFNK
jgi:hypothetical protein